MMNPNKLIADRDFRFRVRLTALAVASCLASSAAWANPNGATVTSGSATITSSGSTLTVTNSPNTIINWHNFSIGTGETTQFIQQSATSAVLNRVTGGDPSLILGTLQSNGRVFLINPAGIVFGAGSVVDVAGLVASTLNIEDGDFLSGKHRYNADIANPGNVVNQGNISTPSGGFVYLIGTQVENSGVINTPSGEAILAAGHSVEIVDSTDPSLRVQVRANSQDVNLSQLMLENDGNIFSALNSGRVSANTVTQDATGKIYFKSAGTVETTSSSIVEAKGTEALDGGYFQGFAAQQGTYAGQFNASGRNGGFAETSGATLDLDGINLDLRTLSADGTGGHWLIDPTNITIDSTLASTIETQLDANTSVTINTFAAGPDAGNIIVASDITTAYGSGVTLTLQANNDITVNSGVDIEALSGPLNVTLNADADANGSGAINFIFDTPGSATIDSNGGNIVLGGGTNPLTGLAQSVVLDRAGLDAGTGNLTINGIGVQMNEGFMTAKNLTINAGSGTLQLIGDGSGDVDVNVNQTAVLRGSSVQMSNGFDILSNDFTATGALSLVNSSDIFASNNVSISNGSITLSDSSITAANNLNVTNGGNLTTNNSIIEAQGTSATMQVGSVFMDNDSLIEVSGDLTLTASSSYTAINNSQIQAIGTLNLATGGAFTADSSDIFANGSAQFSIGGPMTVTNMSIITGAHLTIDVGGTASMTNVIFDAINDITMNASSLTMSNSTIGDSSVDNIAIVSDGNIVLSEGSELVADQEISLQVGGKLYLNSNTAGPGGSHISTFSDNTIFLYFPALFSGGFVLDGVEEVLISPFNSFTGFFTGTNLDNLAILDTNLFITYAPAAPIIGIVGQTTTTTLVTNPYLDPYGPGQTGPGASSYPSDVNWSPYPIGAPFSEVRECS